MSQHVVEKYYVPSHSRWPIIGALALFLIAFGAGHLVIDITQQRDGFGGWVLAAGFTVLFIMLVGWFRDQINESLSGTHGQQLDRSYRQGMSWFIFSEVMFFAAFFGALFYARNIAVPWLGGESNNAMTNAILWPDFDALWPLTTTPQGSQTEAMGWYGLPLLNTVVLLTSSVTCHFAHLGLEQENRKRLAGFLGVTVLLGMFFLFLQGTEYIHAYEQMNLTLQSGVYGNTFFLLTGFHGLHVTLGTLLLFIMLCRVLLGHFNRQNHFAFLASSWYWHFVDVVWVMLFFFVYII